VLLTEKSKGSYPSVSKTYCSNSFMQDTFSFISHNDKDQFSYWGSSVSFFQVAYLTFQQRLSQVIFLQSKLNQTTTKERKQDNTLKSSILENGYRKCFSHYITCNS